MTAEYSSILGQMTFPNNAPFVLTPAAKSAIDYPAYRQQVTFAIESGMATKRKL
jgi:dihydrodipicolinate synthase/N-acetylneuraminate lyase